MSDLISRQAAIDAIEGIDWYMQNKSKDMVQGAHGTDDAWYKATDVYKALEELPSAQPQRMRGRWIPDNLVGGGYWVCTACKHPTEAFAANIIYNFCPSCGADMREGEGQNG